MGSLLGALFLIGLGLDTSAVHAAEFSQDDLKTLAVGIATAHNLNAEKFLKVLDCESGFNPKAIGDHGTSFGIAQLHYPLRDWSITKEQAFEPLRSMEIMANAWERGLASRWSCWKP